VSPYTFVMAHPRLPQYAKDLHNYGMSLELEIFNQLKAKGARLTLAFAEACNDIKDMVAPDRYRAMSPVVARNLKALFRDARGEVVACSSTRTQYSYIDLDNGGFFANMFLEALNEVTISSKVPTWEDMMRLTVAKTSAFAKSKGFDQVPYTNVIDTSIKLEGENFRRSSIKIE